MSAPFDPYYKWLGIRPQDRPITHYRLLGIARGEDDPEVIQQAADRQMAFLRIHQTGPHAELSQKLLNEVARARLTLLDPQRRRTYDASLQVTNRPRVAPPPPSGTAPPPASVPVAVPVLPTVPTAPVPSMPEMAVPPVPPNPMISPWGPSPYATAGGLATAAATTARPAWAPNGPHGGSNFWDGSEDSQDRALTDLFDRARTPGSGFDSVTGSELNALAYDRRRGLGLWFVAGALALGLILVAVAGLVLAS